MIYNFVKYHLTFHNHRMKISLFLHSFSQSMMTGLEIIRILSGMRRNILMKESLRNVAAGSTVVPLLISNTLSFDKGLIKTKISKIQKIFTIRSWLNR